MPECDVPREDYLPLPIIHLSIDDQECDLECAKSAAIEEAMQYDNAPQLVSWYGRKQQGISAEGEQCPEGTPIWVAEAESQGANLTIDVNNEDYVFIFRKSHGLP